MGVVCFFILGGFFYKRTKGDTKVFWKKKFDTLILPWFFCSLLTYIIKYLLSGDADFVDYIKWIFGVHTWYYYFSVFMICLVLFKFIILSDVAIYGAICINIISLAISSFDIYFLNNLFLTPYLKFFNWIGFFCYRSLT